MRVGLYARVSTSNGQHADMQVAELREYIAQRGWEIVGEFVDEGVSGARERRPALDRLWAECRKRRVDALVVYRYDRFARSLRQLVNALEEFRALGIDFVSLHEGVDTSRLRTLRGRETEDKRKATGSIADHSVLQIKRFRGMAAGAIGADGFQVAVGNPAQPYDKQARTPKVFREP